MSLCAAPSKIVASVRPARPARVAMAVRCEATHTPMDRMKQVGVAILSTAVLATAAPSFADDGEDVFTNNCYACHAGGQNSVKPELPLEKSAIAGNLGAFDVGHITTQIENGGGGMPAWKDNLEEDEIAAVAAYVYDKASNASW